MRSNIIWIFIILIFACIIALLAWLQFGDFSNVAGAHNTIATSTPMTSTNVATSTMSTSTPPLSSTVVVDTPVFGAVVTKTFIVSGKAPGAWYFEASFPIQVRDDNGNVIANTHATAQSDWMTVGLVQFIATTTITTAYSGTATLILLRDNPSGLPENDDSVSVPIVVQQ